MSLDEHVADVMSNVGKELIQVYGVEVEARDGGSP